MKRGERAAWRALVEACKEVAESSNYAEEHVAKTKFRYQLHNIKVVYEWSVNRKRKNGKNSRTS